MLNFIRFRLFDRHYHLKQRCAALEQSLQEIKASLQEIQSNQDELKMVQNETKVDCDQIKADQQSRLDTIHARVDSNSQTTHAQLAELQRRNSLLERLLTSTVHARPPGATEAVAQLPVPSVSVIMPTYNRARFITEAIASVQAQSFRHWELVIVDDGSTDGTDEFIAPFLADPRIRLVRQENSGAAAARNRGLEASTAPFIAYLDSDNLWYPDFLARAVDYLTTEPSVDLIYGALVTEHHHLGDRRILFEPFDRETLLKSNFVDSNVMVHRRSLIERFGAWDATLGRLADWDLLLRYTSEKPARQLDVLAAFYRSCDTARLSLVAPYWANYAKISAKWFPPSGLVRRPRVLYVLWHYPQLSETYVEAEIACMLRWGVHLEVWCVVGGPSPYPTRVPIHRGSLEEAMVAARPDVIHVHWLSFAHGQAGILASAKIPVTLRLHGFDVTRESLAAWLTYDWVNGVYAFPNQLARCGLADARLKPTPVAFDTQLFTPQKEKDRRLVVRTAAALASKDLTLFMEAAKRLPSHRFVLAVVTCHNREEYVSQLLAERDARQSPVDIRVDVPREEIVELVGIAGLYLHTLCPPGTDNATPVGQPVSLSEAMATGAHCFARDLPDFVEYLGKAGALYGDLDDLVDKIRATELWTDYEWKDAQHRAVEQAFQYHADTLVLREMFNEWVSLAQ